MESWKNNNLLLRENNSNKSFKWIVAISGGKIDVQRRDRPYPSSQFLISPGTARTVEDAIRKDMSQNLGETGLAPFVDERYKPYIKSITFKDITEGEIKWAKGGNDYTSRRYTFRPITRFYVEGIIPEDIPLDTFEKYICDYVEGQCSDGWGESFEQKPLPSRQTKDSWGYATYPKQLRYYSPWFTDSKVWINKKVN